MTYQGQKQMQTDPIKAEAASSTTATVDAKKELKPVAYYVKEILPDLPKDILKPNFWRSGHGLVSVLVIGAGVYGMNHLGLHWGIKLLMGLVMGIYFAQMFFLAHEALHGSIFKNKSMAHVFGLVAFAPIGVSPSFWKYWHNKLHHGNTQRQLIDPDAFPSLRLYKQSNYMQRMYKFFPGSKTLRSYFYFFFWFTFHIFIAQHYLSHKTKLFKGVNFKKVYIELFFQYSITAGYIYLVGANNFVWGFLIPFFIGNYILMSYIATNHNISPLTKVNDPLRNSLTVTNHPVWEYLHLNFGYHTEHHLIPTMCMSKAKKVHQVLKEKFPEDFQVMSKWEAVKRIYTSPRIYKNDTTLIDPITGETKPTL